MADIELVIKIPEEIKEDIDNYRDMEFIELPYLIYIIRKGIRIPKGHGRLIDAKVAYKKFYSRCYASVAEEILNEVPTIIEANKGEEE